MVHLPLAGLKVLVVEDEILISIVLEDLLIENQSVVVGPFARLETGLQAANVAEIDIALVDVNLSGALAFPIAEVLSVRRIPFLLLSGYSVSVMSAGRPDWRYCGKPFKSQVLIGMMLEELGKV